MSVHDSRLDHVTHLAGCTPGGEANVRVAMDLERQRDILYQWFQGEFYNFQQWQYEKEMERKGCGEAVHDSVFSMFYNVSVPKIGTHRTSC